MRSPVAPLSRAGLVERSRSRLGLGVAAQIERVFPGVPPQKARDWAEDVRRYAARPGHGDLERYVTIKFGDGVGRPFPSLTQARQILRICGVEVKD
jgi:hypothetical protein